MVLNCRDLPLWPCPSIVGDSMGTSHTIRPPSPAPQAPLGSQGIRGRKEALCLGRGRPGKASNGAAPAPGMWQDFETPRTRVPGGCAELPWLTLAPLYVPQSLLRLFPTALWFSNRSHHQCPRPLPPAGWASLGQVLESRRGENSLPQPLSRELKSQLCTHVGDLAM